MEPYHEYGKGLTEYAKGKIKWTQLVAKALFVLLRCRQEGTNSFTTIKNILVINGV